MSPTTDQIKRCAQTISGMKFYPMGDAGVRTEVMDLLWKMVDTAENLEWFRCILRDRVRDWPGLAELRAIYCTSKKPKDGIEGVGYSATAGFTPGDIEREKLEAPRDDHARIGAGRLLKQLAAVLEIPEPEHLTPPSRAKPIPDPEAETRRRRIADEYDRMRAQQIISVIDGGRG